MKNDDYLWDGSGEPDPEVERLELLLEPFRLKRPAPVMPAPDPGLSRERLPSFLPAVAAGMLVVILAGSAWYVTRRAPTGRVAWEVAALAGAPLLDDTRTAATGRLDVGEWIETDGASRARLKVLGLGQVDLEPNTRLRLVEARADEHRMVLQRGTIHARITAPPRLFYVDTPAAVAVDLGCAYTLEVDDSGSGELRVTSGWVGLEWKGREAFIPAGGRCATRPGDGPGTPYYEDATAILKISLATLDTTQDDATRRRAALDAVLSEAGPRDALTLWHLLARLDYEGRGRVYDRMAVLAPPPRGVTRDGILRGDRRMLGLWWDELGLGKTSWWRIRENAPPAP